MSHFLKPFSSALALLLVSGCSQTQPESITPDAAVSLPAPASPSAPIRPNPVAPPPDQPLVIDGGRTLLLPPQVTQESVSMSDRATAVGVASDIARIADTHRARILQDASLLAAPLLTDLLPSKVLLDFGSRRDVQEVISGITESGVPLLNEYVSSGLLPDILEPARKAAQSEQYAIYLLGYSRTISDSQSILAELESARSIPQVWREKVIVELVRVLDLERQETAYMQAIFAMASAVKPEIRDFPQAAQAIGGIVARARMIAATKNMTDADLWQLLKSAIPATPFLHLVTAALTRQLVSDVTRAQQAVASAIASAR